MKVNNSLYDKSTHKIGKSKVIYFSWYLTHCFFFLNPLNPVSSLKIFLLRLYGAKIGKGVNIKPGVTVKYPWKLSIGENSWIGENVWIDNVEKITIGKNVCISQGSLLLTGSHDHTLESFDYLCGEIILEDGVWIGAKSVVGKSVICRTHSILGVNSVAEKNLDPYVIYKGNPAKAIIKRKITT